MSEVWIQRLEDKNHDNRREAAFVLGNTGDPEVIAPLLKMAADPEEAVWAATHRGELVDPDSPDHPRVVAIESVLRLAQNEDCWVELRQCLTHRDPDIRGQAAWCLGYCPYTDEDRRAEVEQALKNALKEPDQRVVYNALLALENLRAVELANILPLQAHRSVSMRWVALRATEVLPEVDGPASMLMVATMVDPSRGPAERALAARVLARSTEPRVSGALIAMLREEIPILKQQAALSLGILGDKAATTPLFQLLIDSDEHVRYAAGIALGRLGDSRTIPFLLKARRHGDEQIKVHASQTIDLLGRSALSELIDEMRQGRMPYRQDAIGYLKDLADPRSTLALIETLLDDEVYQDVREAVIAIGRPALVPLAYVAGNTDTPVVFQEKAIRLLAQMDHAPTDEGSSAPEAEQQSSTAQAAPAEEESSKKKGAAKKSKGSSEKPAAKSKKKPVPFKPYSLDVLIAQMSSSEPSIRALCARVLGRFAHPDAIKPLLSVIDRGESEAEMVLSEAVLALGAFDFSNITHLNGKTATKKSVAALEKSVREVLMNGVDHFSSKVRASSIVALGDMRSKEAVELLAKQVVDVQKDNRVLMIQALAKIGDVAAVKPLLEVLEEARSQAYAGRRGSYLGSYVVQALAKLGEASIVRQLLIDWDQEMEGAMESLGAKALPQLSFALKNEGDAHLRALAAQAMGVVGNQQALGDLIAALQDEDEQVRHAAAYSLNQIHQKADSVGF